MCWVHVHVQCALSVCIEKTVSVSVACSCSFCACVFSDYRVSMSSDEASELSGKRSAVSPLQEEDGKRVCLGDISFLGEDSDQDATILTGKFESSTPVRKPVRTMPSMRAEIKSALSDPEFLAEFSSLVGKAVVAQVTAELRKEVKKLQDILEEKDNEIVKLTNKVDDLEQYTRRNSVRINAIPETENENTSQLVTELAKAMGVDLPKDAIDRSHRIGQKTTGSSAAPRDRPIIVKFTSFQHKLALVTKRSELRKKTGEDIFPHLNWPLAAPASSPRASARNNVYINDDLTAVRAQVFRKARQLKKENQIADTWTRDGFIFVKLSKDGAVLKATTLTQMNILALK